MKNTLKWLEGSIMTAAGTGSAGYSGETAGRALRKSAAIPKNIPSQ